MTTVCRLKVYTDAGYIICFHGDKYTTVVNSKRREQKKQNKTKRKINVKQTKRQRKKALSQFTVCESAKRWRYPLGKGLGLGLVSHFLRPLS